MLVQKRNGSYGYLTYDEDSGSINCHKIPKYLSNASNSDIVEWLKEDGQWPGESLATASIEEHLAEEYISENNLEKV